MACGPIASIASWRRRRPITPAGWRRRGASRTSLPREPDLRTRIAATGLRFDSAGENVGYSTRIEEIHDNLMRSRGHRENLLAAKYDSIGIAIYQSGGRYWVTQDFARVTSLATAPQAANEFAAAVAELRRRPSPTGGDRRDLDELRSAACEMARRDDVDASLVPTQPGRRHVVVFTTFEPGELTGPRAEPPAIPTSLTSRSASVTARRGATLPASSGSRSRY